MLHEKLREARKRAKLTQQDLALLIGVQRSVISKYEGGVIEPSLSQLRKIADSLDIPICELLENADTALVPNVQQFFIRRLLEELSKRNNSDTKAAYEGTLNQEYPLTLGKAKEIAEELGVTFDYLTGRTMNSHISKCGLGSFPELADLIDDADKELVDTVHEICGMNPFEITDAYATGTLEEVWNPVKIDIVREYIKDSQAILQKMIAALIKSADAKKK